MSKHVALWLDLHEARIFHIHHDRVDEAALTAPHNDDSRHFFGEIARSLEGSHEILVVGPSSAKLDFVRYVHKHHHALEPKIVGVETVDDPTPDELVVYARKYFVDARRTRLL